MWYILLKFCLPIHFNIVLTLVCKTVTRPLLSISLAGHVSENAHNSLTTRYIFIKMCVLLHFKVVFDISNKVKYSSIITDNNSNSMFLSFFSVILIGPLVKLNGVYTSIKTRAYEYLISALISQC